METEIRKAAARDAENIANVHVAAWKIAYRGIVPQALLDSLEVSSRTPVWEHEIARGEAAILVAASGDDIHGFACGGKLREPIDTFDAELYAIYLLPSAKGMGLGRALLQRLAWRLAEQQLTQMAVWVLADNPSRGFYAHLGAEDIAQKQIEIGGATLMEVAYGWRDIRRLALP